MKRRKCFVANSSSSSFVCEVCNKDVECYSEWDDKFDSPLICENEHAFCVEHVVCTKEEWQAFVNLHKKYASKDFAIPIGMCPICSFGVVTDEEARDYILVNSNTTYNKAKKEILDKFGTGVKAKNEFQEYIVKGLSKIR